MGKRLDLMANTTFARLFIVNAGRMHGHDELNDGVNLVLAKQKSRQRRRTYCVRNNNELPTVVETRRWLMDTCLIGLTKA
jgi:hypothetical protein